MLRIQIGTEFLDLDEKSIASFTMENPLFASDNLAKVYSFPFSVETSPKNVRLTGFRHRLDAPKDKKKKVAATMWLLGQPISFGNIRYVSSTNNRTSIRFESSNRDIKTRLEKIKLNESFETIPIPVSLTAPEPLLKYTLNNTPDYYRLVVAGVEIELTSTSETKSEVVLFFHIAINDLVPGYSNYTSGQEFISLNADLVDDFPIEHTSLIGIAFDSQTNAADYNAYNFYEYLDDINNNPIESHAFPVINHLNFYENNQLFSGFVNWWNTNTPDAKNVASANSEWEYTYTPMLRFKHIINTILSKVNYQISDLDFFAKPEADELLLYSNLAIDDVIKSFNASNSTTSYLNSFKTNLNLNDFVPDVSALEMLNMFLNHFNLWMKPDRNEIIFKDKRQQLKRPPMDWTYKAEPEYNNSEQIDSGYTIDFETKFDNWISDSGELDSVTVGEGDTPISLPFAPNYVRNFFHIGQHIKMPVVDFKGSSYVTSREDYDLRIMLYKGLQSDYSGGMYPMATNDTTDIQGNTIGDFTLKLTGENNFHDEFHLGFTELINADDITKPIRLTISDILKIQDWENTKVHIYSPDGAFQGIIKTIQFKASIKGMSIARVTFKKR